jgi:hypothetical protein
MANLTAFLKSRKFEKKANLDKVMPTLKEVITDSPYITVILFSAGEQPMHGTPFDQDISNSYQSWRDEQQKGRTPIVTVLQGYHGAITNFSVTPAQWPIELPALPPELAAPPVAAKQPAPAPVKPRPIGAPLIVSGRKSATNPPPVNTASAATTGSATAHTNAATQTNAAPPPPIAAPVIAPTNEAKSLTAAASTNGITAPPPPPASVTAPTSPPTTQAAVQVPSKPEANAAPTPIEAAAPPTPGSSHRVLWLSASLLAVVAGATLMIWLRRPRAKHTSLITRSLDRDAPGDQPPSSGPEA